MNESQRIKKDFEHFKATGDDYPYCQRTYDKKAGEKLFCAAVWCFGFAFSALCWFFVAEYFL